MSYRSGGWRDKCCITSGGIGGHFIEGQWPFLSQGVTHCGPVVFQQYLSSMCGLRDEAEGIIGSPIGEKRRFATSFCYQHGNDINRHSGGADKVKSEGHNVNTRMIS